MKQFDDKGFRANTIIIIKKANILIKLVFLIWDLQPGPWALQSYAPVNILPARGGGGHTRGFRQKTIPDRREFDKLMESGSRVI